MPTLISHAAVPLAIGVAFGTHVISRRLMAAGVIAAILPDMDVVAFKLGIAYSDAFGHRGASHSGFVALLTGFMAFFFAHGLHGSRRTVFTFIAFCTISHGILDMFTDAGEGVALWWPYSDERFFAPWQVIEASPLSLRRVFGPRGLEVLQSEVLWVWLPALSICMTAVVMRMFFRGFLVSRLSTRK